MIARSSHAGSSSPEESWSCLIEAARLGSRTAIGYILSSCRRNLSAFASQALNPRFRGKFDTSDLVQETFLDAHRRFDTFHGRTRGELLAWLRQILINNMLNLSQIG